MELFKTKATIDSLDDLLDRERKAILNGDYDQFETLLKEKERFASQLDKFVLETDELQKLREKSQRNGILYDAMRAGVRSALDRLRAMKEPTTDLKTYDQSGERKPITGARVTTERRA